MRQRIDEERRVVDEHRAEDARPQQASPRVPYREADGERHAEAHEDRERDAVTVLKAEQRIGNQIRNVGEILGVRLLHHEPADVRPQKAALDVVGIEILVDV